MTFYKSDWEGDGFDECEAAYIVKKSMQDQDYSEDVDGVDGAYFRNSDGDCESIVAGAAVIPDEGVSAGVAFGLVAAAAALVALLFFAWNKLRRKPEAAEDMSLISNSLNGSYFGGDDPYANTIDVHKCTSIY